MKSKVLVTGVTIASLFSFVGISPSAHAWSDEKCHQIIMSGNEYKFQARNIGEMIHLIESTSLDTIAGHSIRTPWEMGMIPNLSARKLGYQDQLGMIAAWANTKNYTELPSHQEALDSVRSILYGLDFSMPALPDENPKLETLDEGKKTDREELGEVNPVTMWAVCAYYQPYGAIHCYEELKSVMKVMMPEDNIIARDRIYEVLSRPGYQEPLSILALEYIEMIEQGLPLDGRRLDEDLLRALGSETKKWNVLAVLASRGANFYKLFEYASKKDFRTIAALGVIASASLYFDSLSPNLFSFPRGVQVNCDSGKSYHFWMSAYLARRFGSKWAAYITDVGYQMKSKTEFRDPNRAFTEAWDSSANQKIRLDLAYSAAGAEYGEFEREKHLGEQAPKSDFYFDVDASLDRLETSSERLAPVSKADAADLWNDFGVPAFYRWNRIFHPEVGIQ